VDDESIRQARIRAIEQGASVSAKVREFLTQYASGDGRALRRAMAEPPMLPVFDGGSGIRQASSLAASKALCRPPRMTPDVDVLVAASRADHPHHQPALRWLQAMAQAAAQAGEAELGLLSTVVGEVFAPGNTPRCLPSPPGG